MQNSWGFVFSNPGKLRQTLQVQWVKGCSDFSQIIVRPVINHSVFFVKQNHTLQPFGAWFFLWTWHVIEPVIYKFIWIFECFQFWWFVRGCPSGKSTRISKITKFGSIDISRTKWFKMTFWFSIVGGHFTFPKGHSTIPQTGHNELVYEVFRTSRTKIHQCFISTSTKCSLPVCSRGHGILVWMVRFVEGALTLQKLFFFLDGHHIPPLKGLICCKPVTYKTDFI